MSVTKSLTFLWMTKLKDARDDFDFNKFWTSDGSIMVMEEGSAKPKVIYGRLLNQWLCCVLHYGKDIVFWGFYFIYFRVIGT